MQCRSYWIHLFRVNEHETTFILGSWETSAAPGLTFVELGFEFRAQPMFAHIALEIQILVVPQMCRKFYWQVSRSRTHHSLPLLASLLKHLKCLVTINRLNPCSRGIRGETSLSNIFQGGTAFLCCKGSQPFSDHVPLQRSDRWACIPSAFQKISMYPLSISTDEHVPLTFLMTGYFIMVNHRYI